MHYCERCSSRGAEAGVSRVLMVVDVVDELPDGELQLSNHDAFTTSLCMECASGLQLLIQEFLSHPQT